MAVLVLDSEALSALARPARNRDRHTQVRAAMRSAHARNNPIRVPSAVLVELYRGKGLTNRSIAYSVKVSLGSSRQGHGLLESPGTF